MLHRLSDNFELPDHRVGSLRVDLEAMEVETFNVARDPLAGVHGIAQSVCRVTRHAPILVRWPLTAVGRRPFATINQRGAELVLQEQL